MVETAKGRATELPPLPDRVRLQNAKTFTDYAQKVLDGWASRQKIYKKPARRAESPNAWFKREAYRLLKHYIESGKTSVFSSVARRDERPSRLVEEALRNPFKLGLLAMFADESMLRRGDRHTFGNQMIYAWAHDVPPEFLNAFLAVSGGPALISRKLKEGFIEPGFEHRYVASRVNLLSV